jgi:hypothetical protein
MDVLEPGSLCRCAPGIDISSLLVRQAKIDDRDVPLFPER